MTTLLLIRHGETDWNQQGRYQGHADVPLNSTGREQAHEVASWLGNTTLDAIYSSDLKRSHDTATVIARACDMDVHCDPRLREIDQGEWEGMLLTDIEAQYPDLFERRLESPLAVAPPGGETLSEVRARVLAAISDIICRHTGGRVVVVSHGLSLALVRAHAAGIEMKNVWGLIPPNAVVKIVELESGDFK